MQRRSLPPRQALRPSHLAHLPTGAHSRRAEDALLFLTPVAAVEALVKCAAALHSSPTPTPAAACNVPAAGCRAQQALRPADSTRPRGREAFAGRTWHCFGDSVPMLLHRQISTEQGLSAHPARVIAARDCSWPSIVHRHLALPTWASGGRRRTWAGQSTPARRSERSHSRALCNHFDRQHCKAGAASAGSSR